jgi:hypothetical protein
MARNKKYDVALIYQVTETELKKEWDTYETREKYETAHVCMCVYGGALDYPKIVSKGCKDIVDTWEMVALSSREHGDPPKPSVRRYLVERYLAQAFPWSLHFIGRTVKKIASTRHLVGSSIRRSIARGSSHKDPVSRKKIYAHAR